MNLFSQHTEAKKSEIIENILLYLNFTQHQTLNPKIYTKKIPNTTFRIYGNINTQYGDSLKILVDELDLKDNVALFPIDISFSVC